MANTRIRAIQNFGNLPRDGSRSPIQTTNSFVTQDATGTPITSPLAYTTGVTTLVVPPNAVSIVIQSSVALKVSEVLTQASYYTTTINGVETLSCGNMANIYLSAAGAATIQFRFNTV